MGQWLTPDNPPPAEYWVRKLYIPADEQYSALVSGALSGLIYPSSFEAYGAATPDEVAEAFGIMYDKYTTNSEEPPFWGDENDVDREKPVDQPWYETLSDWVIEGFLAISGFPTAAIVYSTSVPKIRLAIRNHDLGALFRVLLDNLEIYTGDSYGPIKQLMGHTLDLEQFAIDNDLGPGPWQLRIEHDGPGPNLPAGENGQLQIVRQRLTADMPIQFRQTTPNIVEYSEDGGTTWQTAADLRLMSVTHQASFEQDADTGSPIIYTTGHASNGAGGMFFGRGTRGTKDSPQATQNNDLLLRLVAGGHGGTNYSWIRAALFAYAAGNWSESAQGAYLAFRVTPAGGLSTFTALTITDIGQHGVTVFPTAWLHLPAGSAAASHAPLKINAGTLLTTPEPGALEYDGTHFYGTDSAGVRHQLD